MSAGELTGEQILALLHELAKRLAARGIHGDIKLVGGAALILQGLGNRPTADIDASYANKATVNIIVAEMAEDYDLASDWLNSNASAFIADDETLLAMKIAAERDKDTLDIARLLRKLNITNATDAVDVASASTENIPSHSPPAATTLGPKIHR